MTFLALGITALFGQDYVGVGRRAAADVGRSPGSATCPFLGPILFDHDPLTYLSFARRARSLWCCCSAPASA